VSYTVREADRMYDDWRNSGTDKEFAQYWELDSKDLIEIADAYARARGAYKEEKVK
jgi:hypothetical protein